MFFSKNMLLCFITCWYNQWDPFCELLSDDNGMFLLLVADWKQ